jgi:putative oxidoreductase
MPPRSPYDALLRWRDYSALPIRLFAGTFLIYMSQDNVLSAERMLEFERFLRQFGFPVVPLSARVSVYAQFLAGICFLLGALTRPAALLMTINFVVAIGMVHLGQPFRAALEPSAMLASALFLLLNGAGRPSVDAWWVRTRSPSDSAAVRVLGPAGARGTGS